MSTSRAIIGKLVMPGVNFPVKDPSGTYTIDATGCSCPAFRFKTGPCKHMDEIARTYHVTLSVELSSYVEKYFVYV